MKKILLTVAVVAAACLASCSSTDSKAVQANESDIKAKIENCTNPDSLKVYVDQIKTYAEKLVSEGKIDEAKKYLDQLQPVVDKYAPSLAGTFATVQTAISKLPSSPVDSVKAAGAEALDSLKSKGSEAVDNAVSSGKEAVSNVAESAKATASQAVSDAKQKASDATESAKEKVSDAAESAKEKAADLKDAATDKLNGLLKK